MNQEDLQAICLTWAGVTEDIKWGADLVFSVGGKMFCVANSETPIFICFKVPDEEFENWIELDGVSPAPYMARAKWVQVKNAGILRREDWIRHLFNSYCLVAAKLSIKLRLELGIGAGNEN